MTDHPNRSAESCGLDERRFTKALEAYWDAIGGTDEGLRAALVSYLTSAPAQPSPAATVENKKGDQIHWLKVNDEPFEYAIQQGPHGDEFVKLLNGECLRRPLSRCSAGSEPVAWRVDGTRGGETHVWFYWKPEWPAMHIEHGDKVTPLYTDEPQSSGVWQPIETAPAAESPYVADPEVVLLWVADGGNGGKGTHAFGRCYKSHDGSIRATASGFHGNWRITHWMRLTSPMTRPPSQCDDPTSQHPSHQRLGE